MVVSNGGARCEAFRRADRMLCFAERTALSAVMTRDCAAFVELFSKNGTNVAFGNAKLSLPPVGMSPSCPTVSVSVPHRSAGSSRQSRFILGARQRCPDRGGGRRTGTSCPTCRTSVSRDQRARIGVGDCSADNGRCDRAVRERRHDRIGGERLCCALLVLAETRGWCPSVPKQRLVCVVLGWSGCCAGHCAGRCCAGADESECG